MHHQIPLAALHFSDRVPDVVAFLDLLRQGREHRLAVKNQLTIIHAPAAIAPKPIRRCHHFQFFGVLLAVRIVRKVHPKDAFNCALPALVKMNFLPCLFRHIQNRAHLFFSHHVRQLGCSEDCRSGSQPNPAIFHMGDHAISAALDQLHIL